MSLGTIQIRFDTSEKKDPGIPYVSTYNTTSQLTLVKNMLQLVCMCIGHGPCIYKRKANGI